MKIIPVGPVSPWAADPVADAKAMMLQVGVAAASIQWQYYNDPAASGTGNWQFRGVAYFTPPGATDQAMYVVQCGGCTIASVGGMPAAPAPSFSGMASVGSPLFGSSVVPVSGRILGTNAQTRVFTLSATNPTKLLFDMQNALKPYNSTLNFIYYDDTANSGIWRVQGTSYYFLSGPQLVYSTVVQAGGNSRSGAGSPAIPPPSWGSGGVGGGGLPSGVTPVQVFNLFPFL